MSEDISSPRGAARMSASTPEHDRAKRLTKDALLKDGYRVFDPEEKVPDLFALKDNRLSAVEVLGKRSWSSFEGRAGLQKRQLYSMFDEVLVYVFDRFHPELGVHPSDRTLFPPE